MRSWAQAGAEMVDMEFCDFQLAAFYPPELFGYPPNCSGWMASGAILVNSRGERFFKRYFPDRPASRNACEPRSTRLRPGKFWRGRGSANGTVYLNCSGVPFAWMTTARKDMYSHFKRAGVDLTWQPMEVAPANHTCLGGLRVDEHTESTTITGLYAAGESAGGVGRIESPRRQQPWQQPSARGSSPGESAAAPQQGLSPWPGSTKIRSPPRRQESRGFSTAGRGVKAGEIKNRVQNVIQGNLWLKRHEGGLKTALKELEDLEKEGVPALYVPRGRELARYLGLREALEAANLVQCGLMVTTAALTRQESRGSHQRTDYPETDNANWLKNIILRRDDGHLKVRAEPVTVTEVPLP